MNIKLTEYISNFLIKKNIKNIYCITGGGSMHLNDSFGNNKLLKVIYTHHEQAAAMAAEGEARITGKPGVVCVSTGPGGTNTITGIAGAWIDSIPMIIFSGQVAKKDMIGKQKIRQFGVQELNIIDIVKPITKYAKTIYNSNEMQYELEKSYDLANSGRKGPVWLDIPLDVQNSIIILKKFTKYKLKKSNSKKINYNKIINLIKLSKKPLIITGYGIRSADAVKELKILERTTKIPFISSWNSSDLFNTKSNRYIGRMGLFGDRASNYIQNSCDLILVLGSRMSHPQIGYNYNLFATKAKKIVVDISKNELNKNSFKNWIKINEDLKSFLLKLNKNLKINDNINYRHSIWLKKCIDLKKEYPVIEDSKYYINKTKKINSFEFINEFSNSTKNNEIIVTDMGTSFTCTMQAFNTKKGQRLFTSSGLAAMGFGLPGSIGAAFANKNRRVICITGDGGLMFNIQELQTLVANKLKIKLILLDNAGYLTQKLMMKKNFKNLAGADQNSGVTMPNFLKILKSFNIKTSILKNKSFIKSEIKKFLKDDSLSALIVKMEPFQPLIPRYQTIINKDGSFKKQGIESMFPFLKNSEHKKNLKI